MLFHLLIIKIYCKIPLSYLSKKYFYFTIRMGQWAYVEIPEATLPTISFFHPDLPLDPIIIKLIFFFSAYVRIPSTIYITVNTTSVLICTFFSSALLFISSNHFSASCFASRFRSFKELDVIAPATVSL